MNENLSKFFGSIGRFCASHPVTVILVVVVFVCLSSVGILKFEQENRVEELWVPKGSVVLEHAGFYASNFQSQSRSNKLILVSKEELNILSDKSLLEKVMKVHLDIMNLEAFEEGNNWNFTTLCLVNKQGECEQESVLSLWNYNLQTLQNDPNPLQTINQLIPADKIDVWLGGITYSDSNGKCSFIIIVFVIYLKL